MVIGSGPIVIGQAAEFDYAGTQACRSLREEGVEVILVNSNPATIMTDKDIADKVYIEPLNVKVLEQIIEKEKPDSILPTLGGQAGLNLGMELEESGFLAAHNVKLLGTTAATIRNAEGRQEFKDLMERIGEPCAASRVVENVEDGVEFTNTIGYPVVLRPAYTLGGSGGGIAHNQVELEEILENGLRLSRVGQVLVERCIAGWKEIEYEVMRDSAGNCITVCNMENIDPVGVHTGDSIVVAPSQTLSDKEYQMLRTSALKIINELQITGGCNVQFALHPTSFEYCVIEVNPRVSRSSALASKATGYPIAKVAAKIALGFTLDEIKKDGKIKIGVFSDKNPFGYVDENGDVQGYDIYFGKRLAKDLLGSEDDAEFTYVEAASRVEYLQSAKVDVILANFTVTDDRAEKVDFALPYMKVALGVVSPDDALIKDVKDLEGKKLIVVKGTTAETYFTDNYPDIELVKFDEYQEAYDALLDGRGDAFSTDNTEVLAWAQQNEGFSVGIESLGDIDTIAPAVQKGNTDLLNAINDEIKSLADEQFFHKDFEETLKPVYGDNINPDDLVVEGGVVDSEEKAEDADAAETEDSDAASDDTKDAETTEEPEETEAADAE